MQVISFFILSGLPVVPYPTASVGGILMELVDTDVSLPPLSGGSRNPIHEESTKNKITTESLRDSVETVQNQWIHERILGFSRLASMGYNNLWFKSRRPDELNCVKTPSGRVG